MRGELHVHSYYSDGSFAPAEVAAQVKSAGAAVVALTDHDTVAGVAEMNAACKVLGVMNLPAVELSTYDGCDVHILGYNVDVTDRAFLRFLSEQAEARIKRLEKIVAKINEQGMPLDFDFVRSLATGCLSRGHVALAMVRSGYASSVKECFDKWINAGRPCYVPYTKIAPERGIGEVHAAGGKAVLAHPIRLKTTADGVKALVARLAANGLDGIEGVYKDAAPEPTAFFTALADELGLFVTNGSDYHNPDRQRLYVREIDPRTAKALGIV